jgi:hypothetical protein
MFPSPLDVTAPDPPKFSNFGQARIVSRIAPFVASEADHVQIMPKMPKNMALQRQNPTFL